MCVGGVGVCVSWCFSIQSYKELCHNHNHNAMCPTFHVSDGGCVGVGVCPYCYTKQFVKIMHIHNKTCPTFLWIENV